MAIIAAGNCALVKPNEMAPNVSAVTAEIIRETFDPAEIAVFEGGVQLANDLLELPVDHIFFTGSPAVGKVVMTAAAKHLASVTLELGGKSPFIVFAPLPIILVTKRPRLILEIIFSWLCSPGSIMKLDTPMEGREE